MKIFSIEIKAPGAQCLCFRASLILSLILVALAVGLYPNSNSIWGKIVNDPGAFSNLLVAAFTAMLFVVAALQFVLLLRAETTALKTAEAALKSATIAERQSFSDTDIVDVIINRIDLDRLFSVFEIYSNSPAMFDYDAVISIDFFVKNYGRLPVRIESISAAIILSDGGPLEVINGRLSIKGVKLPKFFQVRESFLMPGLSTSIMNLHESLHVDIDRVEKLRKRRSTVWFYGAITFYNVFRERKDVRFFWKYDRRNKALVPVYEDQYIK